MPRSVSRRYTKTALAKKKWASNINVFTNATPEHPAQFITTVLVENKVQATDPTPTIIKAGNFKLDVSPILNIPNSNYNGFVSFTAVIFFMPEGISETLQTLDQVTMYLKRHPEYIMSMRTCPSDTNVQQGQGGYKCWPGDPIRINTRLKRNLNSGDAIALIVWCNVMPTETSTIVINGTCQYWTRAN